MRFVTRLILSVVVLGALAACGSSTQVIYDIKTSAQLNPDAANRASPVVVRIYELQSSGRFESAEFFSLYNNETAALGPTLVARKEIQLVPSQTKEVVEKLQPGTRVIGIVAAFRDMGSNKWRSVVPIREGKTTRISVVLGKNSIVVKPAD